MEKQIIKDLWNVDELIYSFKNVLCLDDNKKLEDYTNKEFIREAIYILETYYEYGHRNYFMLNGEYTNQEIATATQEVKQLKHFINKWDK